jgi:5-carboxymethyl-2-hydroxymuconate isomerase|tara:strand:- start:4398 stop:4802 length:405 start_codon:yes stop_codon:yes gene_type:complete
MPHIFIEYSANLSRRIDISGLARAVHQAALNTEAFPEGGIRTRQIPRDEYLIADGHPDNAFVHLLLRIGFGRDLETRQRIADDIFRTLCDFLAQDIAQSPLAISLELEEIVPETSLKKSNLHHYVKQRREKRHE